MRFLKVLKLFLTKRLSFIPYRICAAELRVRSTNISNLNFISFIDLRSLFENLETIFLKTYPYVF
jgi:hypothetical protein